VLGWLGPAHDAAAGEALTVRRALAFLVFAVLVAGVAARAAAQAPNVTVGRLTGEDPAQLAVGYNQAQQKLLSAR
jgi:hypothetical protein